MSPDIALGAADRARRQRILRIGLAVALGLVIGEMQEEPFSFLPSLFAFQLLMKAPAVPRLRQGFGFVMSIAVASGVALALANSLQDRSTVYILVLGLICFGCFLAQAAGKGGPLPGLLLVCNAMVPVIAVISRDLAQDVVAIMIASAVSAVLLAWLAHAIFPDPDVGHPPSGPATMSARTNRADTVRSAFLCTIILMPALIRYLANDDEVSVVVLITIIGVLGQSADMRYRAALGLLLGNLIGGLLASLVFYLVAALPSIIFLALLTLAVTLLLTEAATRNAPAAGIFAVAVPTFLILLGLGLTPITDGSGAAFISRFINVALASLYALGGLILLMPTRRTAVSRLAT
jgi:hypothetical protein